MLILISAVLSTTAYGQIMYTYMWKCCL